MVVTQDGHLGNIDFSGGMKKNEPTILGVVLEPIGPTCPECDPNFDDIDVHKILEALPKEYFYASEIKHYVNKRVDGVHKLHITVRFKV